MPLREVNNTHNFANDPSIGKQTVGPEGDYKSNSNEIKNNNIGNDATTNSQPSSPHNSITLPLPIPNEDNKIQTNPEASGQDRNNDNGNLDKNNNNKDSKVKDQHTQLRCTCHFPKK